MNDLNKNQEDKNKESWKKTRNKGFIKFILIVGSIWGALSTVIAQLFKLNEKTFSELYFSKEFIIKISINIGVGVLVLAPLFWFIARRRVANSDEDKK